MTATEDAAVVDSEHGVLAEAACWARQQPDERFAGAVYLDHGHRCLASAAERDAAVAAFAQEVAGCSEAVER